MAFLALRDDIKQALNDSYTKKEIWETLRDEQKIAFGYISFTRYVNRLILGGDKQDKSTKMETSKTVEQPSHKSDDKQKQVTPTDKSLFIGLSQESSGWFPSLLANPVAVANWNKNQSGL